MKKMLICVFALVFALVATAQEPRSLLPRRDSLRLRPQGFQLPDSLAHMTPWSPDYRTLEPLKAKPAVSMTSVVVIHREHLPRRVTVINNNTLRMGSHFNLSNGQAWNHSPFPDAYLDARTLSFPGRR